MTASKSKFWLDLAVDEIERTYPTGQIILSSGISPSASYHIGHFREIMTADALAWGLKSRGRQVEHIHVIDNFDPLRKRYSFLPEEFEQYVGQPICLIPDPIGDCHKSYAEHFYQEFAGYAETMGIRPDQVVRSYEDLYKAGRMAGPIEEVLTHQAAITDIFAQVGRQLPADWTPVQVMNQNNILHNAHFDDWDKDNHTIAGQRYDDGHAKLNWRLDWPARWKVLGVMVEPFSAQEHGAAGSSYDTGVEFAKRVFGIKPPVPGARYANIHLVGETTKMSSSKGNLITPQQALEIMPPEVLRYFVVRSRPDRTLVFDPGVGLFNLLDEFSSVQEAVIKGDPTDFKEAYEFAVAGVKDRVISPIRFNHLVTLWQTADQKTGRALEILKSQPEYQFIDWPKQRPVLEREFEFVRHWLAKYAPAELKFQVQTKLPEVELSTAQKDFLAGLAMALAESKTNDAVTMHEAIYAAKGDLSPTEAFKTIYRVILGSDNGPRAGWFLASLDRDWLVRRFRLEA